MHTEDLSISTKAGDMLVDSVSIDIQQGEHVALHGQSGAGKTLLATALCGIRALSLNYRGAVRYGLAHRQNGQDEVLEHGHNVLQQHMGFVPQEALLDPDMTAENCILTPARLKKVSIQAEMLKEVCTRLEIDHLLRQRAGTLSGGQKQRVALARAFAHGPSAVILDEPTAALNQELKNETNVLLDDLVRALGVTIVSVTHEDSLAQRRIEMADGRVISDTHQGAEAKHRLK